MRCPTAPAELGALVLLALHPGRELGIDVFKSTLFDGDPGFVSDGAVHTPISRLRRAGVPIRPRRYVLDLDPSEVDIVDVDRRARDFIEAAAAPERLDRRGARDLVGRGDELHELWQHDPAEAVGHRPSLSALFDPHRRRHRRFSLAYVRLLAATGDQARAVETLAVYVDRYGDDPTSSELHRQLVEIARVAPPIVVRGRGMPAGAAGSTRRWVQIGRPPLPARAFRPRPELYDRLEELAIRPSGTGAGTVVLTGNGGVGKTQMAAAAFTQARREGVEILVWVNASSRESILTAFADACAAAGVGERADMPVERAADRFLEWLAVAEFSSLVVLDDVSEAGDVQGLWPHGPRCSLLVTTRLRGLLAGEALPLAVEVFTASESVSYLADRLTGCPGDPVRADVLDGAPELAADLGHLPLALAHAAAVIAHEGITCRGYQRRFADRSAALDELLSGPRPADDYERNVATTWALGVDRADARAPVGLARAALAVAAVVDANGAPDALWSSSPIVDWATALRARTPAGAGSPESAAPVTADDMRLALRNLHQFSLVTHDPNGGPLAVRTHVLVQRAHVETLSPEQIEALTHAVGDGLVVIWPHPDNDRALSQSLRAAAIALAQHGTRALWTGGVHPVLYAVGESLGATGLVSQAVAWYADLARTAERRLGPDHPDTLTARGSMADWQGAAGEPGAATAASREVLADCARVLGPDHPGTLTARHNLAYWRGHAGDPASAAAAFEQLLADYLRILGPDHPDTLTARANAADWRGEAGDPAGASAAASELLADYLRTLGPDHPDTVNTCHSIADWRGQAGDAAGAAEAFEQVLADRLRLLGPDHPDTLTARQNMAYWRGHAGDPAAALAAAEEVLTDRLRLLGPHHPETFATRGNIAHWRGETGDVAGALAEAEALLADRLRVLGPHHPDTLTTRHNVALWKGYSGDVHGALAAATELHSACVRLLGADHPHTLTTRHNVAHWLGETGDSAGAAAAFEELLADRLRLLGPNHLHTLATRHNVAHWLGETGDSAAAATTLRELVSDRARLLGPDHPHTFVTRHDAASHRARVGDPVPPGETFEELLADRDLRFGLGHTRLARRDVAFWQRQARRVIRRSWQRNTRRLRRR